ncbi:MAG TPA: GNAT family N-acetyltransferase [Devosiaceae bacterium]|nr:GNAT family N-acetyltransferase [Devosiaceae bacterium]
MSAFDLAAVEAIASVVHKDYYEAPEVLAERRQLYPNGAHLLELGERPVGYVLSHPWRGNAIPRLNALLGELPADADTYYVHDLALLPLVRRVGAAKFMATALTRHATARGFASMSLVAVNGSADFWARQGFEPKDIPELIGQLLSYEEGARYMVKRLIE